MSEPESAESIVVRKVAAHVRDRDELWCRALVRTLTIDDMDRVLAAFLTLREGVHG